MRAAPIPIRFAWAALFALLLALRSLAPAGFMPAFDHGAVTIVACPDADGGAMPMHHRGDHKALHQPCPYASAPALGALGAPSAPLLASIFFVAVLPIGAALLPLEQRDWRRHAPATGPPIAA